MKSPIIKKMVLLTIIVVMTVIAATTVKGPKQSEKATKPATRPVISEQSPEKIASSQTVIYYFMTTYRCRSCNYIENTTRASIEQYFAEQIKNGSVVFKMLNIDEEQNKHFVNEYGLYTKSVVLSSVKDGKQLKWKNLDQVWNLIGQDESFKTYISSEIKSFIGS